MVAHAVTRLGPLTTRLKVADRVGLGALTSFIDPTVVDEVLAEWRPTHGKAIRARQLTAHLGIWFVLGLCLFSSLNYSQVLDRLTGGPGGGLLRRWRERNWQQPSSTALSGLRQRLGWPVFAALLHRLAGPLTYGRQPWSHLDDLLVVAWDGTGLTTPASPGNKHAFNPVAAPEGHAGAHYPNLTLLTLIACGTRAVLGAEIGTSGSERLLAHRLIRCLHPGMLALADRGFYGLTLWRDAAATGAHLLWRINHQVLLPVLQPLPDGSYLTALTSQRERDQHKAKRRSRARNGSTRPVAPMKATLARVIICLITVTGDDGSTRTEPYRLLTTLTDYRTHPAHVLAAAYAQRWNCEIAYSEIKTRLRGTRRLLRSPHPGLVRQEIYGYLIVYQAIRYLIIGAALTHGLDPDRISFTHALHTIRDTVTRSGPHAKGLADILTDPRTLVPHRPGRVYPRAVWRVATHYPSRHTHTSPLAHNASYSITVPPRTRTHPHPAQSAQTVAQRPTPDP
ncbi:IS4 family transposase [Thermoactinospora rubra]|uniref:IS4 family transposase n=1 Tax=Thermoactinospora rubra TaxID=1088767 RepID=UPI001301FF65|nr:IS4 family transposase [Thermoactinospora rubra]